MDAALRGVMTMRSRRVEEVGDAIFHEIERELVVEREGWAADIVARAITRLNAADAGPDMEASLIWMSRPLAFTVPGRHVYISRELLSLPERGVAFVLAHEIGHHRAGHLDVFNRWLDRMPEWFGEDIAWFAHFAHSLVSALPKREIEADRFAFELCRRAGYADDAGIVVMKHLERVQLDYRDIAGVFDDINPTHPATRRRREAIARWAEEDRGPASEGFEDYVAWKKRFAA